LNWEIHRFVELCDAVFVPTDMTVLRHLASMMLDDDLCEATGTFRISDSEMR